MHSSNMGKHGGLWMATVLFCLGPFCTDALAYERYSSCRSCHGSFTGSTSPQGTVFPSGDKHRMHRNSANMGTNCDLCHKDGDNDNPFIGSSNGTTRNPGLGCGGCHEAVGLRVHHTSNGVTVCAGCHQDGAAPPEGTKPVYYGTLDTKANNAANGVKVANTNENWSVGDFVGLDNDGDNLYDLADFDCGPPYRLLSVETQGADLRVSWETVGGRTDILEAAGAVGGAYGELRVARKIAGVGVVTTNYVEAGGATNLARFYRVKSGL